MVAWLSTPRLTTLGGRGRDAAYWSAQLAAYICIGYRHVPWEGEVVGSGNGVGRVGVGRDGRVRRVEVRFCSRVRRVQVDEGGACFLTHRRRGGGVGGVVEVEVFFD